MLNVDGGRLDAHASGVLGEVRAEQELTRKGYRIVARNVAVRGAEIDLVALDGSVLVFIEVKLRRGSRAGTGREAVTPAKQRRISQGALAFMAQRGLMGRQARFDVIEIQETDVTHIVNAFPYQGPAF